MSVITDGLTILGDGSSTSMELATGSVATVSVMQSYAGPATAMVVSDPLRGGAFCYITIGTDSFINGFITYQDLTITLPSASTIVLTNGQTIYVSGTGSMGYDGAYIVNTFTATSIVTYINVSFAYEVLSSIPATVALCPYESTFQFGSTDSLTIFDPSYNASGPDYINGFLNHGFVAAQQIIAIFNNDPTIGHSYNYSGLYTINTVTDSAIKVVATSTGPFNHAVTIDAKIYVAAAGYAGTFSFDSTAPTQIIDSAGSFLTKNFQAGQIIVIQGTTNNNNDGIFTIAYVSATVIQVTTASFQTDTLVSATITGSKPNYITTSLTFNNAAATAPKEIDDSTGNLFSLFLANQTIQISGTKYNDGRYRIAGVTGTTTSTTTTSTIVIYSNFNLASNPSVNSIVSINDGGTQFPATGKLSGYWQRQFEAKDGFNPTWFGAMGNANYLSSIDRIWYTSSNPATRTRANDDTKAIQLTISAAIASVHNVKKVVLPPGQYLHSTIYLPTNVLLTGGGLPTGAPNLSATKMVMKKNGGDSIRVMSSGIVHSSGTLDWNGGISYLDFLGDPTNLTGWAISMRNDNGTKVSVQDMNWIENIHIRAYPQGGIEITSTPINIKHVRGVQLNGPLIYCYGAVTASASFINLSTDTSTGGVMWFDSLGPFSNVKVTDFKSEQGHNSSFPGQPNCMLNSIICTNCSPTSTVIVDNVIRSNTVTELGYLSGNPAFTKGSAVITLNNSFTVGDRVKFITTGVLPPGITEAQIYYVVSSTSTSFQVASLPSGTAIIIPTSAIISGTATVYSGLDAIEAAKHINPGDMISVEKSVPGSTNAVLSIANTTIGGVVSALVTLPGHGLVNGDQVKFYTTGALPANIMAGQIYIVTVNDSSSFFIAAQIGGMAGGGNIYIAGAQFGTHRLYKRSVAAADSPKITWRGVQIRVLVGDTVPAAPQIIGGTGISYTTSEGKFNVVQQNYNTHITNSVGSTLVLAPSTSTSAPLNLPVGTAPAVPVDGDIWYNGTDVFFQKGALSKLLLAHDSGPQNYSGTPIWVGTAPSSPIALTYRWTQVGNMVTVSINFLYAVAASGLTVCEIPLPNDLPMPTALPSGFSLPCTIYSGSAGILITPINDIKQALACLHVLSLSPGGLRIDMVFTSAAPTGFLATVTYWVA